MEAKHQPVGAPLEAADATVTEKSQWRKDAEERLKTAKSLSQKMRFALYEYHQVNANDLPESFDAFYNDWMERHITRILDDAELSTAPKTTDPEC